jgi:hypothetical protein
MMHRWIMPAIIIALAMSSGCVLMLGNPFLRTKKQQEKKEKKSDEQIMHMVVEAMQSSNNVITLLSEAIQTISEKQSRIGIAIEQFLQTGDFGSQQERDWLYDYAVQLKERATIVKEQCVTLPSCATSVVKT